MSEFNEEKKEPEQVEEATEPDRVEEQQKESEQTPVTPEEKIIPEMQEPAPVPQQEPEKQPEMQWAYTWDGETSRQKKGSKGAKRFLIIAAVCLALSVAICLPTILFALSSDRNTPSDASEASLSEQSGGKQISEPEDPAYEVSQTVKPAEYQYVEETTLTNVYASCSPSCCTIYVTGKQGYSIGSGFVLTEDGYIGTNQHVVESGLNFTVIFYDNTEYTAKLIGGDSMRDLAVLKIDAKGLTPLPIGNSDTLVPGQTVVAIGTPYSLSLAGTMTTGIISGVNREVPVTNDSGRVVKTMTLIQTDTLINPGNSGGPLINLEGQVVGINSMKIVESSFEGIGFAIPINYAYEIFNQLIQYGEVVNEPENDFVRSNAYLGVTVYNLEAGFQEFGIRPECDYPTEGILVASVTPGLSVYRAGLQMFDIITEFCGRKISNINDLTDELAKHKAGETVTMKLFRFDRRLTSGEELEITFVLDSAS